MSTSTLACPQCKEPVAVRHHSGRLSVCEGVRVVIAEGYVRLMCWMRSCPRGDGHRSAAGTWAGLSFIVGKR